jgi:hypothetical protein
MATDQEIRDAGFKYIPQQKYLQNPFELPTPDPVTDQGIVATNAFAGSGGDGFSVYNADPNTISNMNPNSCMLCKMQDTIMNYLMLEKLYLAIQALFTALILQQ